MPYFKFKIYLKDTLAAVEILVNGNSIISPTVILVIIDNIAWCPINIDRYYQGSISLFISHSFGGKLFPVGGVI